MPMKKIFKFKKPKLKNPLKKLKFKKTLLPLILFVILIISIVTTYQVIFDDKFIPFTFIGDTNVTFLDKSQAYQALQAKAIQRIKTPLNLRYNNSNFTLDLSTASADLNFSPSVNQAFLVGHNGSIFEKLVFEFKNLFHPTVISQVYKLPIDSQFENINQKVKIDPIDAKLVIDESNPATTSAQISITDGKDGQELDTGYLNKKISDYINYGQFDNNLPIKPKSPQVTTAKALTAKQFIESNTKDPIVLNFEKNKWVIDTKTLLTFINLEKPNILDSDTMTSYLTQVVAGKIDQPVQEGQFSFDQTNKRVAEFKASQEGRKLNIDKSIAIITYSLQNSGPKQINLPVEVVKPKIQTADVNNLGIKELVGEGISNFAHSIENRIYNVNLGATKINGILISPGEVFSFDQTVGDITAATGFKQAYVIQSGKTVLGDGGGICQVSTTLFRAVLASGLPIVERTAHAYRVGYYEQGFPPGLDATVFYPSVDFKFKNDTQNYLLIQAHTEGLTLYVDLYGTSDGRVATISKPVILSQTPPLPDVKQDDPTLPVGTIKQVDFAAWGANVTFNRTVTKNNQTIISETFKSNYRPWAAAYLVGTKTN